MGNCLRKNEMKVAQSAGPSVPIHFSTIQDDILKFYTLEKFLGVGAFSTVRSAVPKCSPGHQVAIKTINKAKFHHAFEINNFKRELEILMTVDHPNIIKLHTSYEDCKYIHIVTEFCSGGELYERLAAKGHYTEQEAAQVMQAVLRAVHNLHLNGICHRDLKPENFLYISSDANSELKLIDFGLSKKFTGKEGSMKTIVGTPYYVAPEIIAGDGYGAQCDVWSTGVILYSLVSGDLPFPGQRGPEVFKKISSGHYKLKGGIWDSISDPAKDLISKLLLTDPKKRITVEKALQHGWFSKDHIGAQVSINSTILESLKSYRKTSKLKQEALAVIVGNLNYNDIKELKEAFVKLDTDNSGFLTFDELEEAVRTTGGAVPGREIREIIRNVGQGRINYSEFLAATLTSKLELNEEMIWNAFKHFDMNCTGYITTEGLMATLKSHGKLVDYPAVNAIIREVDLDEIDGKISFQEFKNMLLKSNI